MEKPDSEGYIHVKWPSKSVPHGGIFHIRKAEEPTPAKTQFLKGLIEESRLAAKLRQKDVYNLRQQDEMVKNTKLYQAPLVRPRTSRRRSLSVIRESGAYETNAYRPLQRGEDREKLKDKLANTMAYGDNEAQFDLQVKKLLDKPKPKLPTKKDTWHDLMTQIRERAEFLAEMEYLGQGVQHREVIEDQIAERMRALQALGIDSECASVRSMMTDNETKKGGGNLMSVRSNASQKSGASNRSKGYQRYSRPVQRKQVGPRKREENILAYNEFPPLEYSPRRRL